MICALGLRESLVARSHECDYPPTVAELPAVVRPSVPLENLTLSEIDAAVAERLRTHGSLYEIDEELLRDLEPDLIVTQDLCQVCAPSGNDLVRALRNLRKRPELIVMTPHSLDDVDANLLEVARATGTEDRAKSLVASNAARRAAVASRAPSIATRPRVFCMEWLDQIYCSGHWVPEMVDLAGGVDSLARRGSDSVRIAWEDVVAWAPEVLVAMPCGYGIERVIEQTATLFARAGWEDVPAVRNDCVYAVDANAYFARPGPRLTDGVELLAHLFHGEALTWGGPPGAFVHVSRRAPSTGRD